MNERIIAAQDLYLNGDKTAAVKEGPDAAFLLRRKGREVPREWEHLVTKKGNPRKIVAAVDEPPANGTKEVKPDGDK